MKKRFYYYCKFVSTWLSNIGLCWLFICGFLGYLGYTDNVVFQSFPYAASVFLAGMVYEVIRVVMQDEFEPKSDELL